MTTPDERQRNLIWGREALAEMSQDSRLPADLRTEAATLLSGYPALARLQEVDADTLETLQQEFINVLCEARWFFMRVRGHPSSTEQRQYSLGVILRHFI